MCYESLVDGEAAERPLATLLRAELRDAVKNGLAAAVLVVGVLAARGADPAVTTLSAAGALALGVVLHQALLVVATGAVRVRDRVDVRRVVPGLSGRKA